MSYILDALQRAETERERGNVPGLNAHPTGPSAIPAGLSSRKRAVMATAAAAVLGAAAAALWSWRAPVAVPIEDTARQALTTPTAVPLPAVPLSPTEVTAAPVARVVAPKPALAPQPPIEKAAVAASGVETPVPLLTELPQDLRQQIPALTVSGTVYSDNPSQRLLLVNGQVLSQGSLAAPDLTLERIGAKGSEFSFRGTRFRVVH